MLAGRWSEVGDGRSVGHREGGCASAEGGGWLVLAGLQVGHRAWEELDVHERLQDGHGAGEECAEHERRRCTHVPM